MANYQCTMASLLVAILSLVPKCQGTTHAMCGQTSDGSFRVGEQRSGRAGQVSLSDEKIMELQRSLILMADEDEEEESDEVLFMSFGTELHQAGKRAWPGAGAAPHASSTTAKLHGAPHEDAASSLPEWEEMFERGMQKSEEVVADDSAAADEWVVGQDGSNTVAPRSMRDAEELLKHAVEAAPAEKRKDKLAERAHRVYHHAKWLAERSYARSAEWRYRLAATLATKSRRSVLASHALSRLGYYLMQWRRYDEAREVLKESQRLNKNSNNLAAYLYGVLERRVAGADEERLRNAEALIHASGEQPSEELEAERQALLEDISYWREAEEAISNCLDHQDVGKILICVCAHGGAAVKAALDGPDAVPTSSLQQQLALAPAAAAHGSEL